jgi:hypothetical protein
MTKVKRYTREYTLALKVEADAVIPVDRVDEIVAAVVDNSTAREAIATGLYYADTGYTVGKELDEEEAAIDVLSFRVIER